LKKREENFSKKKEKNPRKIIEERNGKMTPLGLLHDKKKIEKRSNSTQARKIENREGFCQTKEEFEENLQKWGKQKQLLEGASPPSNYQVRNFKPEKNLLVLAVKTL
jgi:hypothetical protein